MKLVNSKKKALKIKARRRRERDYATRMIDAKNTKKGLWEQILSEKNYNPDDDLETYQSWPNADEVVD